MFKQKSENFTLQFLIQKSLLNKTFKTYSIACSLIPFLRDSPIENRREFTETKKIS
jgi:hypothetical protein